MKQRLKRLFFPDFCFDKPTKYNRTTLHRKIFCLLLYLGFLTLHLSITLFLHASFMICLFCITVMAFMLTPGGGEQAESWTDIVSLSVCFDYIAGIRADGSVVVCGFTFESMARDMAEWENILAIGASDAHIIGLHPNGTVSSGGTNDSGRSNVWHWKDIVDISAGSLHSVGLRSDGTVVAIGHNGWGQCDTDDWTDIIAIDADWYYTIGLRSDGTVLTAGRIWADMEPTGWTDIVAIYGIGYTIAGLKSDGTLVITDTQDYTQDDVAQWSNIRLPG